MATEFVHHKGSGIANALIVGILGIISSQAPGRIGLACDHLLGQCGTATEIDVDFGTD